MKIESKYNVGDKVYYFDSDELEVGNVESITYDNGFYYRLNSYVHILEKRIFNNFESLYKGEKERIQKRFNDEMEWLEDIRKEYNNE